MVGSFEGCTVDLFFYESAPGTWSMNRRWHTLGSNIDSGSSLTMFRLDYTMTETLSGANANNIPCAPTTLHWHPFEKFFYYFQGSKIVAVDAGRSGQAGDACSAINTPTSTVFTTQTITGTITSISEPTYYSGFAYFIVNYSNGTSEIKRWDTTFDGAAWSNLGTFTSIRTNNTSQF